MMTNVMVKTCLSQKIIKHRNLIQAMKNRVYPKVLRRKLSESQIFPKAEFVRIFVWIFTECSEVWIEDVNGRHDMIIVSWGEVTLIQFFRQQNLFEYLPNVPKCGLNTRHDNREVALIHLTRAQTLRSDKCATGSIHTIGSMTINVFPC